MNGLKWLEIAVSVRPEDIECVGVLFDEMGTGGVVIEDPAIIYDLLDKGSKETVAIADLPEPGSLPVIKAYLPLDERLPVRLEEIRGGLGRIDSRYSINLIFNELEESNWSEKWKEFYRPLRLGKKLLVKPSWLADEESSHDLLVIEMDPGMAFGCGSHPTTSMCVSLLEEAVTGGETVLDIGTGSGILAIAAALLGADKVLAVDFDPLAVRVARENVAANGYDGLISVRQGDLLEGIQTKADLIVANIVADVVIRLLPSVPPLLTKTGKFIASGIIAERRDEVAQAIRDMGLTIIKTSVQGQWTAFLATSC